jgi:signal peptidase I
MIHFDFEFLLVLATLLTGVFWLVDALFFAKNRQQQATSKTLTDPILVEYSKSFFPVLLAVMVLRSFMFEPFRIPSGSMMPSLLVGDFILVNKFSYGIRLPIVHTRVTEGDKPKRGDVAVFRYPKNESLDYIKRVIGLPGDHISYYNRRLRVNGKLVSTTFDHKFLGLGDRTENSNSDGCDRVNARCDVFIENFENSGHMVMINPDVPYAFEGDFSVPKGHYFVMGDNRDHSNDSRFWGYVPEQNLVGKAIIIWMHWDWRTGGGGLDINRIGTGISD